MDKQFQFLYNFICSFENKEIINFLKDNNDIKDFKEISIFGKNNVFNNDLLTKDGFIKALFDTTNDDENEKLTTEQLGQLYDNIALMDGNKEMSEEEIKFFASLGENIGTNGNKKEIIDKNDIAAFTYKYQEEDEISVTEFNYDEEYYTINTIETEHNKIEKNGHEKISSKNITSVNNELKINGIIDEPIIQSRNMADCFVISAIEALNSTETGKKIIRNSIIPNEDGTITVNFAGARKSYTFTHDIIKSLDTDLNIHDKYSNGDNDMLVFELGIENLIKDKPELNIDIEKGGEVEKIWQALTPNYKIETFDDNGNSKGIKENDIRKILNKAYINKNFAIGFGLRGCGSAKLINGKTFEYNVDAHAIAITEVKENQVTFKDSYNGKSYTLSWDEFINLKPAGLFSIDLTEA